MENNTFQEGGKFEVQLGKTSMSEVLLSLSEEGYLSKNEMEQLQNDWFDVMISCAILHGKNNLTSELVEQLMGSISYTILWELSKVAYRKEIAERMKQEGLSKIYQEGHKKMLQTFINCMDKREQIVARQFDFDLQAYQETLSKGLDEFFELYDMVLKAQELPGSFDYPLYRQTDGMTGLKYVETYLDHLACEEEVCHLFEKERIERLLLGYSLNYRMLNLNLYELILSNVMGNLLLGAPLEEVFTLDMSREKVNELQALAEQCGHMELEDKVKQVAVPWIEWLRENQSENSAWYVELSLSRFLLRYQQNTRNKTLSEFFVLPYQKDRKMSAKIKTSKESFDKIKERLLRCEYLEDKIHLLKTAGLELDEMIELAKEVLYGEEIREWFLLLSDDELAILMTRVLKENERLGQVPWDESYSWHLELMLSIRMLDEVRQSNINYLVGKYYKK